MALKSYILTEDFKSPYVRVTGRPERPQQLCFRKFKKGEIVNGELKHANNKPAFLLIEGTLVIPINLIKELTTKDVRETETVSGADGKKAEEIKVESKGGSITIPTSPNVKYADAFIIGAIVGVSSVYVAEKQGWITSIDNKNKMYGALAGALAGMYLVFRFKNK